MLKYKAVLLTVRILICYVLAMRKSAALAVFAIIFLFSPGISYGADINGLRPSAPYGIFSTLSATSPPKGHVVMSGTYEALLNSSFYRFGANFAYGISNNVELSMSVSDQREGFEDIALGIKHRFIDMGTDGPSVAYLVTASLDTGSEDVSTDGRVGGGLILTQRVGPVYSHFNIMYAWPMDSSYEGELRLSTGFVFAEAHNVWLLGEFDLRSSHFSRDIDRVEAKIGQRARIAEGVYFDLGLGVDFKQEPTDYRLMASLSFEYPREEKKIKRIYEGR